ncbi:MAG: TIGR04168 family protein [Synechococcus sp.]
MNQLRPDAVLFVGDLSDGDLRLTRRIRSLPHPKAVILGNHDRGRDRSGGVLRQQLTLLDGVHCAWQRLRLDPLPLSIVGGRPCSSGGGFQLSKAVEAIYGPVSLEESAQRIATAAAEVPADQPLVVMAHCGPTGLGSDPASPCGRDWKTPAVDWGDQDLALAIDRIARHRVPDLVVFGHMHHQLKRGSGLRQSLVRDRRGTAYLNAACVPRSGRDTGNKLLLHLSWAEFEGPALTHLSHRWYQPDGQLMHEELLPQQEPLVC